MTSIEYIHCSGLFLASFRSIEEGGDDTAKNRIDNARSHFIFLHLLNDAMGDVEIKQLTPSKMRNAHLGAPPSCKKNQYVQKHIIAFLKVS